VENKKKKLAGMFTDLCFCLSVDELCGNPKLIQKAQEIEADLLSQNSSGESSASVFRKINRFFRLISEKELKQNRLIQKKIHGFSEFSEFCEKELSTFIFQKGA